MSAPSTETSVEALSRIIFRESKPGKELQSSETEQAAVKFLQLSPDNYLSGRSYTRLKPNATKESRLGNRCAKFIEALATGSGVTAGQWFVDQKGSQAPRCSNAPNCHGERSSANEAVSTFFQLLARSTAARLESVHSARNIRLHTVVSCGKSLACLVACHEKWNKRTLDGGTYSRAEWWAKQISELEKLKPEGMSVDQWIDEGDDELYGTIRLRMTEPYKGTLPATDIYPEKTIDWEGLQSHAIFCRKAESGEAGGAD